MIFLDHLDRLKFSQADQSGVRAKGLPEDQLRPWVLDETWTAWNMTTSMGASIVMGIPHKNGWFMMENPFEMDDDWGICIYGNHHMDKHGQR